MPPKVPGKAAICNENRRDRRRLGQASRMGRKGTGARKCVFAPGDPLVPGGVLRSGTLSKEVGHRPWSAQVEHYGRRGASPRPEGDTHQRDLLAPPLAARGDVLDPTADHEGAFDLGECAQDESSAVVQCWIGSRIERVQPTSPSHLQFERQTVPIEVGWQVHVEVRAPFPFLHGVGSAAFTVDGGDVRLDLPAGERSPARDDGVRAR